MKKLLLSLLFLSTVCFAQQELIIDDLTGGKVDAVDATRIPDNTVSDCRNVFFDGEYIVEKRKGMIKLNSAAVGDGKPIESQYEYRQSDGTRYQIVYSSETLYYRLSGSAFTQITNGLDTTNPPNYITFMNTMTWVNGVDNMQSWDTSTVFTQESTYQPRYAHVWQNRIWIAGDSDERTKVRCSEWLDPSDYTVPASPVSTDPAVFDINSEDGEKVMGFADSPNGNMIIFKEDSTYEIGGYDRDDFYLRLVLDIGCIDSRSVEYKDGIVTWLSTEGFIGYDGNTYRIISRPIQGTIDLIQQLNVGSGLFSKNTEEDWNTSSYAFRMDTSADDGNLKPYYPINITIGSIDKPTEIKETSDGTIFLVGQDLSETDIICKKIANEAVTSTTVNSSASFGEGQKQFFTIDGSDILHLVYYELVSGSYNVIYSSSSDGSTWYTTDIATTAITSSSNLQYISATVGFDSADVPHVVYGLYEDSKYKLRYIYYDGSAWTFGGYLDTDNNNYRAVMIVDSADKVHVAYNKSETSTYKLYHNKFSTSTTSGGISTMIESNSNKSYWGIDIDVDSSDNPVISYTNDNIPKAAIYSGSFSTKTIETSEYLSLWTDIYIDSADEINVIYNMDQGAQDDLKYAYYVSGSDTWMISTVDTDVIQSRGTGLYIDSNDYPIVSLIKYIAGDYAWKVFASTHVYNSEIYDTGFTSYNFDPSYITETKNDYNTYHYIRSSDTVANITGESWTAWTNGSIPSITAAQFIQYRCVMSTDIVTNSTPEIDRITINYHGSAGSTFVASMNYDNRIWNAVGISSATYLDRQLIYDKNGAWTDFTSSIGCSSLLNYGGTPYWGSDDGFIYTMDSGESDGSNPIDSYIVTKEYNLGSIIQQKTLDKIYVTADDSGDWNLNLDYYLDRSGTATTSYTIDLDETANIINKVITPEVQTPFYTVRYKLYNVNADEPWDLLQMRSYYRLLPLR